MTYLRRFWASLKAKLFHSNPYGLEAAEAKAENAAHLAEILKAPRPKRDDKGRFR